MARLVRCGVAALAAISLQGCSDDSPSPSPEPQSVTLRNGVKMPMLAAGTWQYNDSMAEETVVAAVHAGFLHIDTAYDYSNQVGVGKGIKRSGKARESLFITSKVPGCGIQNTTAKTVEQCTSETEDKIGMDLQQLNLSYLDLVLVHFPPCPGDDGSADSPTKSSCYAPQNGCTHPQSCDMIKAQWSVLTSAYHKKQVRAIGVSNYCRACLECLAGQEVFPMVNQVMLHVGMGSDPEGFRTFAETHQIKLQAYSPFGSGGHGSEEILKGNLTTNIGKTHGKSAAQVALKWIVTHNVSVATKSANPEHLKANMDIFNFKLSQKEMESLDKATFASEDTPSFLCKDSKLEGSKVEQSGMSVVV